MGEQSDFLKVNTVVDIQRKLCSIDNDITKKGHMRCQRKIIDTKTRGQRKIIFIDAKTRRQRKSCKSYFMEVVSSLCFGQMSPPEPALIKELLNVVFTEQDTTKDFTYSDKEKTDKVPVIRSFLLQLLLEHK